MFDLIAKVMEANVRSQEEEKEKIGFRWRRGEEEKEKKNETSGGKEPGSFLFIHRRVRKL